MSDFYDVRLGLVEEELVSSVARFITIRWLAGLGVLAATWFVGAVLRLPLPLAPLYLIGLIILGYNAVFYFVLRHLLGMKPRNIVMFHRLTKFQSGFYRLAMTAVGCGWSSTATTGGFHDGSPSNVGGHCLGPGPRSRVFW